MPLRDKETVLAHLQDLGDSGIHFPNRTPGICHECKSSIDPAWSTSEQSDARCETCSRANSENPAYTPDATWVFEYLDNDNRPRYGAIIKIDGIVYTARMFSGDSYSLYECDTNVMVGFRALRFVDQATLAFWWSNQDNGLVNAIVWEIPWRSIKEDLGREWSTRVGFGVISFYDIGHGGRGIEEGDVLVRLYLRPCNYPFIHDYDVLAVQLVKRSDEPHLPEYAAYRFQDKTAVITWSQAGKVLTEALLGLGNEIVQRQYERTLESYSAHKEHYAMPEDYWICIQSTGRSHDPVGVLIFPQG